MTHLLPFIVCTHNIPVHPHLTAVFASICASRRLKRTKEMDPNTAAGAPRANPSLPAARSCLTCAKAKARCEKKTGSDVCERYASPLLWHRGCSYADVSRCTRLRKDCHTKDPVVRKRKPVKLT